MGRREECSFSVRFGGPDEHSKDRVAAGRLFRIVVGQEAAAVPVALPRVRSRTQPYLAADLGAAALARAVGADLGGRLPGDGWASLSPGYISSGEATSSTGRVKSPRRLVSWPLFRHSRARGDPGISSACPGSPLSRGRRKCIHTACEASPRQQTSILPPRSDLRFFRQSPRFATPDLLWRASRKLDSASYVSPVFRTDTPAATNLTH